MNWVVQVARMLGVRVPQTRRQRTEVLTDPMTASRKIRTNHGAAVWIDRKSHPLEHKIDGQEL